MHPVLPACMLDNIVCMMKLSSGFSIFNDTQAPYFLGHFRGNV